MKAKILLIMLISMLTIFSVNIFASEYKSEVSVGLVYGQSGQASITTVSQGGLDVFDAATGEVLYTAAPGEEVYIQMGSTGFASDGKFDGSGRPKISVQPKNGANIFCGGKEYRGYIYAERTSQGELLVINYVGTDDYVSSVLGKEMSYSWPKEALKAQAVCARNFVLCRGSAHKDYGFDVCATTHCQVYGGVSSEHENTRRAVEETKGVLATYNGKLVSLYFYATSGGYTEDVENVWGSPYGYLKAVPDTYENPDKASKYKWSVKLSKSEIESKLNSAGIGVGSLQKITVDSISASGRVTKLTFYGTEGKQSVKLEKCRTILGLFSQRFSIIPDGMRLLSTTSGQVTGSAFACSASGVTQVLGYSVLSGNGEISYIDTEVSGAESYTINGGGYGHGVGMSQWGARGMAENGFTYDQILKHYFTGIELG